MLLVSALSFCEGVGGALWKDDGDSPDDGTGDVGDFSVSGAEEDGPVCKVRLFGAKRYHRFDVCGAQRWNEACDDGRCR